MGKKRRKGKDTTSSDPSIPQGCHHYTEQLEVPLEIQKYDEGIWMTDESWFGVTPEPVADKIASHLASGTPLEKAILIDVFAGAGGNTIAFARSGRWNRVYGIEQNPQILACAQHNAEIYGVADKISWFGGDCFDILENQLADVGSGAVIFASPPWGGPEYATADIFDLTTMSPYNLTALHASFRYLSANVVLYLPRNSDVRQLAKCENDGQEVTVVHYCIQGASKAICAYFGDFELPRL